MKRIKYLVKYSPFIYNTYFYTISMILRVLGLFVKTNSKLILFNSFGGRKYDDSPRAIFEYMAKDQRFSDYELVWAVSEPEKFNIPKRAKVVKDYSIQFFLYALRAKVWITNSSMEHGLCFKKKSTIYINTWHGSAIKYLGDDVKKEGKSFKGKSTSKETAFYSQSEYDEYVFKRAFHIEDNVFKRFGLPRNDELACVDDDKVMHIKEDLGIDNHKKVILYCPTFREFSKSNNGITQKIYIDLERWEQEMDNCYLLVRAHYEVSKIIDFSERINVLDVSEYPHLNDLMMISDILISDYSSVFFDYSILHRPMICFAYDFVEYSKNRGMYLDVSKELPCHMVVNENELYEEINKTFYQYDEACKKTIAFQKKYVSEFGRGAKLTCNYLAEVL